MRARVWPAIVAVVLAVVGILAMQVVIVAAMVIAETVGGRPADQVAREMPERLATAPMFMLLMASSQPVFALAALLGAWLSPAPALQRLHLRRAPSWTIYPLAAVGSIPILAVALTAAELLARVLPPNPHLEKLFEAITPGQAAPFVLTIAIAPAVCEELLFRGYLQTRLVERWGAAVGIVAASLMFGLAHIMPHAIVAAAPLGLWFGIVAWRTGSIVPGMLCHAFVNGGLNLWRMIVKFGDISEASQRIVAISALLLGCVSLVLAIRELRRLPRADASRLADDAADGTSSAAVIRTE